MVFVGVPGQIGKTTMTQRLPAADFKSWYCFNLDFDEDNHNNFTEAAS